MNAGYAAILAASDDDRRGLFAATARRIGTTEQNRPDFDLSSAKPGTFALLPTPAMRTGVEGDYARMAGMIFGSIPQLDEVMASVGRL